MLLNTAKNIAAKVRRRSVFSSPLTRGRSLAKSLACAVIAAGALTAEAVPFDSSTVDSTVVVDAAGGGDYTSLADAANAFSAVSGGINANWTILINSDLTETASSTFGNTVAPGKSVTLRPGPGKMPTVTYTMTTANTSGINGGLLVGITSAGPAPQIINTDNFILDGCNEIGGTERHVTIATANQANFSDKAVHIIGGSNGAIRNANITSNGANSGLSHFGIYFSTRASGGIQVPTNWTVSNCNIEAIASNASQGIGCVNESGNTNLVQSGLHLEGNTITARTRGIFLNNNSDTSIVGNTIRVAQTTSGFHSYGIWHLSSGLATGWTINIAGNTLDRLETANTHSAGEFGITAISLSGGSGTYDIHNNMITGFEFVESPTNSDMYYRGIACALNDTQLFVRQNSVNMRLAPEHVNGTDSKRIAAISFPSISGANSLEITNNIVNYAHNRGMVYYANTQLPASAVIDYNVYGVTAAPLFAYLGGLTFSDFPSWEATYETHGSGGFNPFTSAGSAWASETDLHFSPPTALPAGLIAGTPIAAITTDIDGETRSTTAPMPGCDELINVVPAVPMAATDVAVSKVGDNLSVTWTDNASDESGYKVMRSINGGAATEVASLSAGATSYTDEDVNSCSTYGYVIVAYNDGGEMPSAAASFDNGEIPVITILGDNPATVEQFSAYTDAGATAVDACGTDITGDIAASGEVDTDTVGSYSVTYTVTDANGKQDTDVRTVNVVLGPVAAPTGVAVAASGDDLNITWTDNANNETGYRIMRSINGAAAAQVAEIAAGSTSYTDTDINICSSYVYTVVAYHAEDDASATSAAYDNGQLPTVTVLGDAVVTIEVGTAYVDAGATAQDACGNALTPVASGSVVSATVGTYTITYTATDANSKQQSAPRTVHVEDSSIEKVDQVITFGALGDRTYGDAPITLSATASSGLPVSYTATGPATVSGSVLTITGAGTVTVTASQAGGPGFNPAPDVMRSFNVGKANASISVIGYNGTYDGQPHTATGTARGIESTPADLTSLLHITGTFTTVPGGTATWIFDGNENYKPASGSVSIIIRNYSPLRPKPPVRP